MAVLKEKKSVKRQKGDEKINRLLKHLFGFFTRSQVGHSNFVLIHPLCEPAGTANILGIRDVN